MTNNEIVVKLDREVGLAVKHANEFVVATASTYERAAEQLKGLKALQKSVKETFDPIVKKAKATYDEALEQRKKHLDPIEEAEGIYKRKMLTWKREEDERIRNEQEKAQAAEKKKAEDKQVSRAETVAQGGDKKRADKILNEKPSVAPAVVESSVPKISGVSTRKAWEFRIIDQEAIPRDYMVPDLPKIRKVVNALGKNCDIKGVEVFEKEIMGARG